LQEATSHTTPAGAAAAAAAFKAGRPSPFPQKSPAHLGQLLGQQLPQLRSLVLDAGDLVGAAQCAAGAPKNAGQQILDLRRGWWRRGG
jgi:hypothetical protein